MHLNLTFSEFDGPIIERVNEFVYLESYTKTAHAAHDVDTRIAKARAAIYSLSQVWSSIKRTTKTRVFKVPVESILLYDSES